jgi:ribosome-binding factor A
MGKRSRDREAGDGTRTVRLQELIREELNFLLRGELRDPRLEGVTFTMVELSPDGSRARAWFVAENEIDALEALDGAVGFLRNDLASLGLKRTPDLRFGATQSRGRYSRQNRSESCRFRYQRT